MKTKISFGIAIMLVALSSFVITGCAKKPPVPAPPPPGQIPLPTQGAPVTPGTPTPAPQVPATPGPVSNHPAWRDLVVVSELISGFYVDEYGNEGYDCVLSSGDLVHLAQSVPDSGRYTVKVVTALHDNCAAGNFVNVDADELFPNGRN